VPASSRARSLPQCPCYSMSHAQELFGSEFIEGYVASKAQELSDFFDEITPWERRVLAAQA